MNPGALDTALAALHAAPSRTGSVIVTIYGDAILPRGGSLALADLLALMARLGIAEGVVRTAVSRLAQDGLLLGRRAGRRSAYALTPRGEAEFEAAIPLIYGAPANAWDGKLRLAFPEHPADRAALEAQGFATLSPGVMLATTPARHALDAAGEPGTMRNLAARAWPLDRLGALYEDFVALFAEMSPAPDTTPIDAMAARILLIHAWRRIALRDPRLPAALLPIAWPGAQARTLCAKLYAALEPGSELWLDQASNGAAALPPNKKALSRWG